MKKGIQVLLGIILVLFSSCAKEARKTQVVVYDPSFLTIEAVGREANIAAFLNDLTIEIAKVSNLSLSSTAVNWDSILSGIESHLYQAAYSGIMPYSFNEKKFNFSDVILQSGPVLLTSTSSKNTTLSQLSNKEVGVIQGSSSELIVSKYPNVILRVYESAPKMLDDLATSVIEGAILGYLPALGYVNDLYKYQVKISEGPLDEAGLRFVSLKPSGDPLFTAYKKALHRLEKEGTLKKLKQKWSLDR